MTYLDIDSASSGAAILQRDVAPAKMMLVTESPDKPMTLFMYSVDKLLQTRAGGVIGIVAASRRQADDILARVVEHNDDIPSDAHFDCEMSISVVGFQAGVIIHNVYFHTEGI